MTLKQLKKKTKRKFDVLDLELEVSEFLTVSKRDTGSQKGALEYLISQYIYMVSNAPKALQEEAIEGMKNHLNEA